MQIKWSHASAFFDCMTTKRRREKKRTKISEKNALKSNNETFSWSLSSSTNAKKKKWKIEAQANIGVPFLFVFFIIFIWTFFYFVRSSLFSAQFFCCFYSFYSDFVLSFCQFRSPVHRFLLFVSDQTMRNVNNKQDSHKKEAKICCLVLFIRLFVIFFFSIAKQTANVFIVPNALCKSFSVRH